MKDTHSRADDMLTYSKQKTKTKQSIGKTCYEKTEWITKWLKHIDKETLWLQHTTLTMATSAFNPIKSVVSLCPLSSTLQKTTQPKLISAQNCSLTSYFDFVFFRLVEELHDKLQCNINLLNHTLTHREVKLSWFVDNRYCCTISKKTSVKEIDNEYQNHKQKVKSNPQEL